VPTGPLVGEKPVMAGGGMTVNVPLLVAVPPDVVTLIVPVLAPPGTVAVIDVDEFTVKLALVPLKATAVAPVKLEPEIVTVVPTGPLVGEKPVIVGGLETVTVTGFEFQGTPRLSVATAVSVWESLLTVVVFQEVEYGAVESEPMSA